MSGLQETYYIMGIIFMGLMFLLMIVLVIAVFVIRAKINKIHAMVEDKIHTVTAFAERGGELSAAAGTALVKSAKKAFDKAKKK